MDGTKKFTRDKHENDLFIDWVQDLEPSEKDCGHENYVRQKKDVEAPE